ncbi:MAG: SelL-related redox protein [Chitinophagales bacterium]
MNSSSPSELKWIRSILVVTGVMNLLWGIAIIFFPRILLDWIQLSVNNDGFLWRSSGFMSLAMGFAYLLASKNANKYWAIVLIGLFLKILMPINFWLAYRSGEMDFSIFELAAALHLIWVLPFAAILYRIYLQSYIEDKEIIELTGKDIETALQIYSTNKGRTIYEASESSPVLLVFLRHFGCTFCREALSYITANKEQIESNGAKIILAHMVSTDEAIQALEAYQLSDIEQVSDQESFLYKSFNLKRGRFNQLFGWQVWMRGIYLGWIKKHGIGAIQGDQYQMPGVFLIDKGKVVKKYIHELASDVPPYLELATINSD